MSQALLSLADVARLAKVERPVVSMWRKRSAVHGEHIPFPAPVRTQRGDRFVSSDVVAWLDRTGRGNNPDANLDVSRPVIAARVADGLGDSLEALTTLRGLSHESLTQRSWPDLLDLADELDPDDEFMYSEIEAASAGDRGILDDVDQLCEAIFGAAAALEYVFRTREATNPHALTTAGQSLVTRLVWDAAAHGCESIVLTGLPVSRMTAGRLISARPESLDVTVATDDPSRWLTRLLRLRGVHRVARPVEGRRSIHVVVPSGLDADDVLDRVDEAQLGLRPGDVAIAIGAAATLTDAITSAEVERHRDHLLRLESVRHVVRLPAGTIVSAPRRHLAAWVVAPASELLPVADRRVLISDVSNRNLDDSLVDDLVADVVAGLEPRHLAAAHAFVASRVVSLPRLMATRGALITPGVRPQRLHDVMPQLEGADIVVKARAVRGELVAGAPNRLAQVAIDPAVRRPHRTASSATLDELLDNGSVRVVSGCRLDPDSLAAGTVEIITAADVLARAGHGAEGSVRVDTLDLEARYSRARRTEPGDVVFVTSPRPAAVVCREGGAVVAAPARTLRSCNAEVVPEAVAATVNALPTDDPRWLGWAIPLVDPADGSALATALRAIEDERSNLARRHTRLDDLTTLLVRGVTQGILSLSDPTLSTEGDH